MTAPDQDTQGKPSPAPAGQAAHDNRSENLLPADDEQEGRGDGRFGVAEEVNLDQQSDRARHIGQANPTNPQEEIQRDAPRSS